VAKGAAKGKREKPPQPVGRPTKYKPEYCELVIEHMKKGKSLRSFCARVDVIPANVYSWIEKFPDFRNAVELGRQKAFDWWEEQGINGLYNTAFTNPDGTKGSQSINSRIYELFMNNMFDWSMKREIKQDVKQEVSVSESTLKNLLDQAKELAEKI